VTANEYQKIMHALFLGSRKVVSNGRAEALISLQTVAEVMHTWLHEAAPMATIRCTDEGMSLIYPRTEATEAIDLKSPSGAFN
jgi:hypothetical protein